MDKTRCLIYLFSLIFSQLSYGCQRTSNHDLWEGYVQNTALEITDWEFRDKESVFVEYSVVNRGEKTIYISKDLATSDSSSKLIVEVRNRLGIKHELYLRGLRLADKNSVPLPPKEKISLRVNQFGISFWYPTWAPNQEIRISTFSSQCEDVLSDLQTCGIVLVSEWTKMPS